MPLVLQPGWMGRRVVVRTVAGSRPDGRPLFRDVVGDLLDLDANRALVEHRGGVVPIPLGEVALARLVTPSTAQELALEAVAAGGWRPDESGAVGGWVLRAAAGFTGRANSVLPLRPPGMPLDDALAAARAWYARRAVPLRVQVPTEARRLLDAELAERGWPASPDVAVLAARLDALTLPDPGAVRLAPGPSDGWLSRYRDGAGHSDVAWRLLTRHDRAIFASVERDGTVVAIARGVVDRGGSGGGSGGSEGWLGISAVEVAPEHRRQGLARTLVAALRDWATGMDATRAYLQVARDNHPALALYDALGFWHHHDYRYRTDPDR